MLRHAVAVAFVLVATVAMSQPTPPPAVTTLSVREYEGVYIGNERLADELKFTPEQRKWFSATVYGWSNNLLQNRAIPDTRKKVSEDIEKDFATKLKPEQRARLRQVILQHLARIPAGGPTLAADADVVAKLALSDEQLKSLRSRTTLAAVLTPAQAKTWGDLTGPAYPHRLEMRHVAGGMVAMPPREMTALNHYPAIAELKLDDAQLDKLEDLFWMWYELFPDLSYRGAKLDGATAAFGKAATALLTPAQKTRLAEILMQADIHARRNQGLSVFELPPVVAALGVADDQKAKLAAARRERRKELIGLFLTGDPAETIKTRAKEHQAKTPDAIAAVLTAEQRTKFPTLTGKPLAADYHTRTVGINLPYDRPPVPPKGFLGLYTAQVATNTFPQQSFKPDAEQKRKLAALAAEFKLPPNLSPPPGGTDEQRRARAAELDKRLADILTPEQLAAARRYALVNFPFWGSLVQKPRPELLALDVFADVVKLTPQQTRLVTRGAQLGEVLTPEQRKAWVAYVGEPPRPTPTTPSTAPAALRAAFPYTSLPQMQIVVLRDAFVQKELKFTAAQSKAVAAALVNAPLVEDFPPFPLAADDQAAWLAARNAEGNKYLKAATATLDDSQRTRVRQIAFQQCVRPANTGALPLYAFDEVVEAVKLTAAQRQTLAGLVGDYIDLFAVLTSLPEPENRANDDRYAAAVELTRGYEKKCQGVLTDEQRAAWKGLFGEAYKGVVSIR